MLADINDLRRAVDQYRFNSVSSEPDGTKPCTIRELNALRDKTAELFSLFVEVLEKDR